MTVLLDFADGLVYYLGEPAIRFLVRAATIREGEYALLGEWDGAVAGRRVVENLLVETDVDDERIRFRARFRYGGKRRFRGRKLDEIHLLPDPSTFEVTESKT